MRKHLRQIGFNKTRWLVDNIVKESLGTLMLQAAINDFASNVGEPFAIFAPLARQAKQKANSKVVQMVMRQEQPLAVAV